jgi:hypothetical protein
LKTLKKSTKSSVKETPPRSALQLAFDVLQDPRGWLEAENSQFGGRRPIDLIGTAEEVKVYNLLNAVDQGLF